MEKKYKIIYADPPWDYSGRKLNTATNGKELNDHYPTMSISEICKLPIKKLADKNCLLFMWVTYPHLEKSFEVIEAWGFKYSTVAFEWLKMTTTGKNVCFMGSWTCGGGIELCLLAHKGSVPRIAKNIRKMIIAQRREHSRKPGEAKERIVQLVGDLQRIELFAREKTEGWDVWGNEVESDIKL